MNWKQKLLTIIALIAVVVIGRLHYLAFYNGDLVHTINPNVPAIVPDVWVAWFMLGAIYFGLFFLLADKKEKRP